MIASPVVNQVLHPSEAPQQGENASPEAESRGRLRRLEKRLLRQLGQTSERYRLIEPGDRVLVGISGGKDSMSLLHLLARIRERAPFEFSLVAVNLDQGHPGFPSRVLPEYFEAQGYDYRIIREDTYSIVKEKLAPGSTYCSLCSRLRRGILYNVAQDLGCTKIALGHHREDTIETLLLNLLYSGQIKAMPPRLQSDDGRNVVIRPLLECSEAEIAEFAELMQFPIIPCDLCGSQENLKRKRVKRLIEELTAENCNVPGNLLAALSNVRSSHLMAAPRGDEGGQPPAQPELIPASSLRRG